MPIQTLRPDGTVVNTDWTLVNGGTNGTIQDATGDNDDGSFVRHMPEGGEGRAVVTLGNLTALAPGAQIRSVTRRFRYDLTFPSVSELSVGLFTGDGSHSFFSDGGGPTNSIVTQTGTPSTQTAAGQPLTEAMVNDLRLSFGINYFGGPPVTCRIYELYLDVLINLRSVATVTGPVEGSTVVETDRPNIVTGYSDPESDAMDRYRIKVFSAAQYGAVGFDPETSVPVWDSGETFLTLASGGSFTKQVGVSLPNNTTYRAYSKTADSGSNGRYSAWDFNQFTVAVDPPAVPGIVVTPETSLGRFKIAVSGRDNILSKNQGSVETDTTGFTVGAGTEIARHVGGIKEVPTVRSSNTTNSPLVAASIGVVMPAGFLAGDLLLLQVAVIGSRTVATPAGWTQLLETATGGAGTDVRQYVFYRVSAGGEAPVLVVSGSTPVSATCISVQKDTYSGNPYGGGVATASNAVCTGPGTGLTEIGAQVFNFFGINVGGTSITFQAASNQPTELSDIDSGGEIAIAAYHTPVGRLGGTQRDAIASAAGPNVGQTVIVNGAVAVQVPHGSSYLRFTITSAATPAARSFLTTGGLSGFPVEPGRTYTALFNDIRSLVNQGKNARAQIRWYKADGTPSTTAVGVFAPLTTAYQQFFVTAAAPADAAFAAIEFVLESAARFIGETFISDRMLFGPGNIQTWTRGGFTPTTFDIERSEDGGATWVSVRNGKDLSPAVSTQESIIYDYEATPGGSTLYRAVSTGTDGGSPFSSAWATTPSLTMPLDQKWRLKDPLDSSRNIVVKPEEFNFTTPEPQGVYRPIGRTTAVVTSDGVKSIEGRTSFLAKSKAEYDALALLLFSGRTLLLQDPFGRQWYLRIGQQRRTELVRALDPTGTYPIRHLHRIEVDFTEVSKP